ncbi:amidase domain-containing protein [Anaeromonas gelatinilytica]|uniref:amidase domain-containing protein n=1 Tax=Anaeromonas gelatinilytica TaxID=2683194 RepID=UPI001A9C52F5|nr:amidase domain-containing protein [Anaeromonas gelatinilytica]
MSQLYRYNRQKVVEYAKRWAFDRNPKYYNFDKLGGDCTNFISQVIHAGGCPMNYTKWTGWYYSDTNNRAPSWTSANYLRKFLLNNQDTGPIVKKSNINEIEIGDIIQLNFDTDTIFEHSLVIVDIKEPRSLKNIYISAHTYDRYNYSLANYIIEDIEYYHILGYKK